MKVPFCNIKYLSQKKSTALQYWLLAPRLSRLKLWQILRKFLYKIAICLMKSTYQFCLSEVLKLCAERLRDPQKGTSCELASVTLKYNSWPPQYTLNPGPHPSHAMDHSLNRLWSHAYTTSFTNPHTDRLMIGSRPQLTPISVFRCPVTQKGSSLPVKPLEAAYKPSACLYRFAYVLNQRISVKW